VRRFDAKTPEFNVPTAFDRFIDGHRDKLFAMYLLSHWYPGSSRMQMPYPTADLSESDLEDLKARLNSAMPCDSMILDLHDWDVPFQDDLGDDWYFEAAFGGKDSESQCAEELAELFTRKADEYGMEYEVPIDSEDFQELVQDSARTFIEAWRQRIKERFADLPQPSREDQQAANRCVEPTPKGEQR
jgi:hypothetical protein